MYKKNIAIIGSTGSIGTQTLDIVSENPERFGVSVLAAGSRVTDLIEQAKKHRPNLAVIADESKYSILRNALEPLGIETAAGSKALADAMERDDFSTVVTATVGYSGLEPTIRAIRSGKDIALANKETLVVAGELITRMLATSTASILPVDSEHSAIYQCLVGEDPATVDRLIITASGGPFRTRSAKDLQTVTVADALKHPNWNMGNKITIDSATMMNKAFEIIEARWLFNIPGQRIEAVVHPQSIVHSMVQFCDGAVKAQLGVPDMHLPIRYALGDARRTDSPERRLTLSDYASLTFEKPDVEKFPCLNLAYRALDEGGTTPCIINAANEIAVAAFLEGRIKFLDIYKVIETTLERTEKIKHPSYEDLVATNAIARTRANEIINSLN
ncbi:MAG: 1-deoxy-D-xylulose-5-phosphate reductoisomerase [Paramuribaculum sp.]|nr:1-deoxy-D-xylulose-5-phosphate reductoisomerase [Paramuribaculum sp.]